MKPKEDKDMKIDVNLNITDNRHDLILFKLDRVLYNQEKMMATAAELKAELVEANKTTDEIAADIADLVAKVGVGSMSPTETQEVMDQLTALKTKLQGVAAVHTPDSPV